MRSPRLLRRLGPQSGRLSRSFYVPRSCQRRCVPIGDGEAVAALAARIRRRGDPSLLLVMGGCALHRPHAPSLSPGVCGAFHLRRPRSQCIGARPDPRDDALQGQARRRRFDQSRVARRRPPDAGLCAGAGGLGQGPGDRSGPRHGQGGIWADVRDRDPGERPGRERRLLPRLGEVRLRDRVHRAAWRAGARRPRRVPQLQSSASRVGRGGRPEATAAVRRSGQCANEQRPMKFLDSARVFVRSGDGGAGCVSLRREKFIEFGGPDGGDGGRGGDGVVRCVGRLNTLIDFRYQQHFKARTGMHGMGKNRAGGRGADAVLKVPVGTQVIDEGTGALIADLTAEGQRVVVAQGGNGGFGNAHFTTSTNRAPRRANPGQPGIERTLFLRLKLIADAGLVGLPNAGKSTFLAAVSAAKPKIADYPFTTLHPGLGVVSIDGHGFVLADIPGLVEGAHEVHGLGDRFLGLGVRCGALVHLVDATGANAGADYRTVRRELAAYGEGLEDKAEIVCLSKVDAVDEESLAKQLERLKRAVRAYGPPLANGAKRAKPLPLSTAARRGVTDVLRATMATIEARREATAAFPLASSPRSGWEEGPGE